MNPPPDIFRVPEPSESFDAEMDDGTVIRVRRHGNPDGPRLVMAHGNGFAIDAYYPFWRLLTDRYDLAIYDQRNHGRNPRHDADRHDVPAFVADMDRLVDLIPDRFGPKPTVGVFHSISAVTAIWHALEHGWKWGALALFDPPLIPSPGHRAHEVARTFELGLADWAASRPDRFPDAMALAAGFARSKSLARWVEGGHALMARSITREDPKTGEYVLCCPREGESRVYRTNAGLDLCPRLGELRGPLVFISSDPDAPHALAPGKVGRAMKEDHGVEWTPIENTSHLLQIERPDACHAALESFLARQALG